MPTKEKQRAFAPPEEASVVTLLSHYWSLHNKEQERMITKREQILTDKAEGQQELCYVHKHST